LVKEEEEAYAREHRERDGGEWGGGGVGGWEGETVFCDGLILG